MLENTHSGLTRHVPNWTKVLQVDAYGRTDAYACLRNPDYQAWWLSLVEDQVRSYPLDGIMWGSERQGPLDNALSDGGFARTGIPYCFCEHCVAAGTRQGIDARRAREGYVALDVLLTEDDATAQAVGDSTFVRFLRLLGRYPEIVAWDQLWHDGYEGFQGRIYGAAKFLDPDVQVGWHVWHHNSFSPFYRAQVDFGRYAAFSDFVKPVVYHVCAGYRLHHYIQTLATGCSAASASRSSSTCSPAASATTRRSASRTCPPWVSRRTTWSARRGGPSRRSAGGPGSIPGSTSTSPPPTTSVSARRRTSGPASPPRSTAEPTGSSSPASTRR